MENNCNHNLRPQYLLTSSERQSDKEIKFSGVIDETLSSL